MRGGGGRGPESGHGAHAIAQQRQLGPHAQHHEADALLASQQPPQAGERQGRVLARLDQHHHPGTLARGAAQGLDPVAGLRELEGVRPARAQGRQQLGGQRPARGVQGEQQRAARGSLRLGRQLQRQLAQSKKPAAPRPPPPEGARVRIRAVGDVMLGTSFPEGLLPPDDGAQSLARVAPLLRDADLTFINLEGLLCDNGETQKCRKGGNCYAFRSPTRYGAYLKDAGVDLASTANNHSGDFGELCRRETEATLDGLGIAWSGPAGSVASVEKNGLRVGLIAFHTSANCNYVNDHATAAALVRSVKQAHDLVLVSFHGGAEGGKALNIPQGTEMFYGENRGHLRAFTHAVIDAGADLVIGHGPHVVRALEFYKDKLVLYSLGNFATYGSFNLKGPQGLGMIADVELDGRGRFLAGRLLPTRQEGRGIPQPDANAEVLPLVRRLTAEDFPTSGARVSPEGVISPPKASASR